MWVSRLISPRLNNSHSGNQESPATCSVRSRACHGTVSLVCTREYIPTLPALSSLAVRTTVELHVVRYVANDPEDAPGKEVGMALASHTMSWHDTREREGSGQARLG